MKLNLAWINDMAKTLPRPRHHGDQLRIRGPMPVSNLSYWKSDPSPFDVMEDLSAEAITIEDDHGRRELKWKLSCEVVI